MTSPLDISLKHRGRSATEVAIRAAHDGGDLSAAAAALIQGYGGEVFSFLCATLADTDLASDAFQVFSEQMWKSLPKYRRESSYRTWAYAIARNCSSRVIRDAIRRRKDVPLSAAPELFALAERVRTTTLMHLRTDVKDRVTKLSEHLGEDDRTMLVLRVSRNMSWPEIARIMSSDDLDDKALAKQASALRQRFQRTKSRLRDLVEDDGLAEER